MKVAMLQSADHHRERDRRMRPDELAGARVLVAGAGVSGLAAAAALVELGAHVTVTDARPAALADLPPGAEAGDDPDAVPAGTALVVTCPGRRPDHPLVAAAAAAGVPLVGEPELAWWLGQARERPPVWLVVTGTNGKTTTIGMLAAILRAAGRDAVACGNIGYPVVDAVRAGHEVLAVELSSFQLHWSPSIRPLAGLRAQRRRGPPRLARVDGRLRRREGQGAARGRSRSPGSTTRRPPRCSPRRPRTVRVGVTLRRAGPGPARRRWTGCWSTGRSRARRGTRSPRPSRCTRAGRPASPTRSPPPRWPAPHGVGPDAVRAGLDDFRPGPHRGGVVATVGGVRYVDDSKATNPHAAAASLAAQAPTPIVWIVGGLLKGASVDELVARHGRRLRAAVVIGTDRAEIVAALARHAPDVPVAEVGRATMRRCRSTS